MTLEEFKVSMLAMDPPLDMPSLLLALWHDAKGDWKTAHEIAQRINSSEAAWVHGYLHRKEGDLQNAAYWYGIAKRKTSTGTLETEWEKIVSALLER